MKNLGISFVLLALAAHAAAAPIRPSDPPGSKGPGDPAVAKATRLDRSLSEEAWAGAAPIAGFLQRDPREGAPASQNTEVRVLYDAADFYVSVRAFDTDPARIVGLRTRRDQSSPSDWIRVYIDSYHDRRTAYEFAVNPAGVKQDGYWFGDAVSDQTWDAVWDVSVTTDAHGWRAVFRIPFSQLRFEEGRRETFGFAVVREIGRLNESSSWPLFTKNRPGFVSQFGELGGLTHISGTKRLEVMPYLVGQARTRPAAAGDPFVTSPDWLGSIGGDLKYAVTPGLTLTATANPDFGQVESDPAVVNLTAFETFYEERRPFFVEGSGALKFDTDCSNNSCTGLFYSRRIGRSPQGAADTPAGGFSSAPTQTTILTAAKLTGRVGAFSIGVMDAVTGREQARVALGASRSRPTVEPLTNFAVAQARREWQNQSSLSFMLTSTNRVVDHDTRFLASHALTGGVSWDWRLKDPHYAVTGYWVGSAIAGEPEAITRLQNNSVHLFQRTDAEHVESDPARRSLSGHAGQVGLSRTSGPIRFGVEGKYKTPGFDSNDVGYMRRADTIDQSAWVQFRWDTPTRAFRSARISVNEWVGWNFDGDVRTRGGNVNTTVMFPSQWTATAGLGMEGRVVDDRSARGGPAFTSKRQLNGWASLRSDNRKALGVLLFDQWTRDESGSTSNLICVQATWRPTAFLNVAAGTDITNVDENTQWVKKVLDQGSTRYVFGHLGQTTVQLTARVNYTITPNLTLQLYAEPFVSAGAYSAFKSVVRPLASSVDAQFDPYPYSGRPDFNVRSLRMTNVIRWEYKPGSVIYVMWQQGRESSAANGAFQFGHDFGRVFGTPGSNVFLVKASFWLNF